MFGFNRFSCFRAKEEFMFYAETAENRTMTNLMSPMTTLNIFLHIYNFFSRVHFKTINLWNKPNQFFIIRSHLAFGYTCTAATAICPLHTRGNHASNFVQKSASVLC